MSILTKNESHPVQFLLSYIMNICKILVKFIQNCKFFVGQIGWECKLFFSTIFEVSLLPKYSSQQ